MSSFSVIENMYVGLPVLEAHIFSNPWAYRLALVSNFTLKILGVIGTKHIQFYFYINVFVVISFCNMCLFEYIEIDTVNIAVEE